VPSSVRVDRERRVSYVSLSGLVTFSDLAQAYDALAALPSFDPTFPVLVDLRAATDVVLTHDDMRALAAVVTVAPSTRRAILVGSLGILGMAQMYEAMRRSQTDADVVRACQTLDAAAAWLGVAHLEP
jgi:hypothetical protein